MSDTLYIGRGGAIRDGARLIVDHRKGGRMTVEVIWADFIGGEEFDGKVLDGPHAGKLVNRVPVAWVVDVAP